MRFATAAQLEGFLPTVARAHPSLRSLIVLAIPLQKLKVGLGVFRNHFRLVNFNIPHLKQSKFPLEDGALRIAFVSLML